MRATKALAMQPMGILKTPKFHGPGRKRLPTKKTRMKIGVVKATKAAQAPMLKMAPMAMLPVRESARVSLWSSGGGRGGFVWLTAEDEEEQ